MLSGMVLTVHGAAQHTLTVTPGTGRLAPWLLDKPHLVWFIGSRLSEITRAARVSWPR